MNRLTSTRLPVRGTPEAWGNLYAAGGGNLDTMAKRRAMSRSLSPGIFGARVAGQPVRRISRRIFPTSPKTAHALVDTPTICLDSADSPALPGVQLPDVRVAPTQAATWASGYSSLS